MDDQSELAPEAGPEVVTPAAAPGQAEVDAQEGEQPEGAETEETKRSTRSERRKAVTERLARERDAALAALAQVREREERVKRAIEADTAPREADFPDPLEYAAARGGWHAKRGIKEDTLRETEAEREKATQRLQEIAHQERQEIAESWNEQLSDARKRYADFDAVALNPKLPLSERIATMIATSDVGADVAYHLGKNPGLAAELALLADRSPVEAARRLGRIEAGLSAPRPRTETSAPPPISPVKGPARAQLNPDNMSFEDYKRARMSGKLK